MSEPVRNWLNDFFMRKIDMITAKDIKEEIEEVRGDISNNRLWAKGADSVEEAEMFENNIADLEEYLEVLNDMLKEFN